jgi:ubiquinone/menaquinone biosynthesis C-methylase UbiE
VQRRNRPELMDQAQVDEGELAADLCNLAWFNRLFGGIAVIQAHLPQAFRCSGVQAFRCSEEKRPTLLNTRTPEHLNTGSEATWTVLDVATGGGDIPRWLARRKEPAVELLAADLHPQMLQLARRWSDGLPIRFLRCDARRLPFRDRSVEFVLCSQMLHHLTEADAVGALREMGRVTRRRLVVHDLRRSRLALLLIWLVTRFSRNRLTRYDSPTSFERAFTPSELEGFAREAELDRHGCFRVYRHLYFRMALVYDCAIAGEG